MPITFIKVSISMGGVAIPRHTKDSHYMKSVKGTKFLGTLRQGEHRRAPVYCVL